MKIIFTDTSIYIDSIVFDYHHHDNQILKSKQTFMALKDLVMLDCM